MSIRMWRAMDGISECHPPVRRPPRSNGELLRGECVLRPGVFAIKLMRGEGGGRAGAHLSRAAACGRARPGLLGDLLLVSTGEPSKFGDLAGRVRLHLLPSVRDILQSKLSSSEPESTGAGGRLDAGALGGCDRGFSGPLPRRRKAGSSSSDEEGTAGRRAAGRRDEASSSHRSSVRRGATCPWAVGGGVPGGSEAETEEAGRGGGAMAAGAALPLALVRSPERA